MKSDIFAELSMVTLLETVRWNYVKLDSIKTMKIEIGMIIISNRSATRRRSASIMSEYSIQPGMNSTNQPLIKPYSRYQCHIRNSKLFLTDFKNEDVLNSPGFFYLISYHKIFDGSFFVW